MKLCYQVATPDVAIAPSVTAYQGPIAKSFENLAKIGYDGVELMTLDPDKLDWEEIKTEAEKNNISVVLVCTGEVFGQLGISFVHPDQSVRRQAIDRVKRLIDFAGYLGANLNIGRVRGQYHDDVPKETTWSWAIEAFREISDHAKPVGVDIALETVTIMQTNFINTLEDAQKMVDEVNKDNFKFMMDIFHLNLEEKDIFEAIDKYSKSNIHVHLADNNRRYPGHCGLDFEKILQAFKKNGYDGAFCTEIYQIPSMDGAAEGAMKHLAPIAEKVYGRKYKQ